MRRPNAATLIAAFGLVLCGISLLRPKFHLPLAPPRVAFLVDTSASFGWARDDVARLLAQKSAALPPQAKVALFAFGNGTYPLATTTAADFRPQLPPFNATASRTATADLSSFSRVWLFTDGHCDVRIRCRRLDAVAIAPPFDCSITDISVPPLPHKGRVKIVATVAASAKSSCKVVLTVKTDPPYRKAVTLTTDPRGRVVSFVVDVPREPTDASLSVEAEGDTNPANDTVSFTLAGGEKKVVGYVGCGGAVVDALRRAGFLVRVFDAGSVAGHLGELDGLVLEEVAWEDLSPWVWHRIGQCVEAGALGLAVLGAERAFGTGGYGGRTIEDVLPLNCRPKESPPTALFVVLDGSGSMGEHAGRGMTKWETALQGLGALLRRLSKGDALGVVVFDTRAHLIRPLAAWNRSETETLLEQLLGMKPSGGTNLWRGLAATLPPLSPKLKAQKAILLLSDGKTEGAPRPPNFNPDGYKRHKIAVHVVALGKQPNMALLKYVADATGGTVWRAHFRVDEMEEALKGALSRLKGLIKRGHFKVEGIGPAEVEFYVRTAAKEGAEVLGRVEGAPFAARWRYGAGGVIAVTTSAAGGLARWKELAAFLGEQLGWAMGRRAWGQARFDGSKVVVRVGGLPDDVTAAKVWMGGVWAEGVAVDFGTIEARFANTQPSGPVVVAAGRQRWRAGVVFAGQERDVGLDMRRLSEIAKGYGGKVVSEEEFLRMGEEWGEGVVDVWRYFVVGGIVLLIGAVVVRVFRSRRL